MPHEKLGHCTLCGETVRVEVTESGKIYEGQYQGTRERPKHIECGRKKAIEDRNHNSNLR